MPTATGTNAAIAPNTQRQRRPARNSTKAPDTTTCSAVPRSGCLRISTKGTMTRHKLTVVCLTPGGSARVDRYQAMVIGVMILTISDRSEEHTSELQSRENLVCRRLLEKKKNKRIT